MNETKSYMPCNGFPSRFLWLLMMVCVFAGFRPLQLAAQNTGTGGELLVLHKNRFETMDAQNMRIKVDLRGGIAFTRIEMDFFSTLEGPADAFFYYPLHPGQTATAFFESDDSLMRQAEPILDPNGSYTFNDLEIHGIPARYVATGGFKIALSPIKPRELKKVVLEYSEALEFRASYLYYELPLKYKHLLDEFSIEVSGLKDVPAADPFHNEMAYFWSGGWATGMYSQESYMAENDFWLKIPLSNAELSFTGTDSVSGKNKFFGSVPLGADSLPRPKPHKLVVLWDGSASGLDRDLYREMSLLEDYLKYLGSVDVRLILFSNNIKADDFYRVHNGNTTALIHALSNVYYDGATNLSLLNAENWQTDEVLLFSDGLATWGDPGGRYPKKPVFVINSSASGNEPLLKEIAEKTWGAYIPLYKIMQNHASYRLKYKTLRLLRAVFDETKVSAFYPGPGTQAEEIFSFSGNLIQPVAAVELLFGYGPGQVAHSATLALVDSLSIPQDVLPAKAWALQKTADLVGKKTNNDEELKYMSANYKVLLPGGRFAMLQGFEQYIAFGLQPPSEYHQQYNDWLAAQKSSERERNDLKKSKEMQHKVDVYKKVADRVDWHHRVFFSKEMLDKAPEQTIIRFDGKEGKRTAIWHDNDIKEVARRQNAYKSDESELTGKPGAAMAMIGLPKLQPWDPSETHLEVLEKIADEELMPTYSIMRENNARNVGFYVEVAKWMFEKNKKPLAVEVLSNIAELGLHNDQVSRVLARNLFEMEEYAAALPFFKTLLDKHPENPWTLWDVARCHAEMGEKEEAARLLALLISDYTDPKFEGLRQVALTEFNKIASHEHKKIEFTAIPQEIRQPMPLDLRIVMELGNPDYNVEMWVIDPLKEKTDAKKPFSKAGAILTPEDSSFNVPQEYLLKHAPEGSYRVLINHKGTRVKNLLAPADIRLTIYENYGRKEETKEVRRFLVNNYTQTVDAGIVDFSTANLHHSERRFMSFDTQSPLSRYKISPEDNNVVAGTESGIIEIHDIESGKKIREINMGSVRALKIREIALANEFVVIWADSLKQAAAVVDEFGETWDVQDGKSPAASVVKVFDQKSGRFVRDLPALNEEITGLAFVPRSDDVLLATQGYVRRINLLDPSLTKKLELDGLKAMSVGGKYLAVALPGRLALYDAKTFAEAGSLKVSEVSGMVLSADGQTLSFSESREGIMHLVSYSIPKMIKISEVENFSETGVSELGAFCLSADGQYLASQPYGSNLVNINAVSNGAKILSYYHEAEVKDIMFTPDSRYITSSDSKNSVRVRHLERFPFMALPSPAAGSSFTVSPDGMVLIAKGESIKLYESKAGGNPVLKPGHAANDSAAIVPLGALSPMLSPKANLGAYLDKNKEKTETVFFALDPAKPNPAHLLAAMIKAVGLDNPNLLAASDDGKFLAFAQDTLLYVCDLDLLDKLRAGKTSPSDSLLQTTVAVLKGHTDINKEVYKRSGMPPVEAICFSPDGKLLASKGDDMTVRVWEPTTGALLSRYETNNEFSEALSFTPDNRLLFEDVDNDILLWDWAANKVDKNLRAHTEPVTSIDVDDNGKYMISASMDHSIRLWNLKSGNVVRVFYDIAPQKALFTGKNSFISSDIDPNLKLWRFTLPKK